jgi:hypothetical protein
MYHTITFVEDCWIDLEQSLRQPLERVLLRTGTRVAAQLKPYVVDGGCGPVEVADLFFEDGSTARCVPFARFSFVD